MTIFVAEFSIIFSAKKAPASAGAFLFNKARGSRPGYYAGKRCAGRAGVKAPSAQINTLM